MQDWEQRRQKKQAELARQLLEQDTYSFKPQTTNYSERIREFPKEMKKDQFLLQGMTHFLDKQQKAKKIKLDKKEQDGKNLLLKTYFSNPEFQTNIQF